MLATGNMPKRYAYVPADKERTEFQNEAADEFQNGNRKIPNAMK